MKRPAKKKLKNPAAGFDRSAIEMVTGAAGTFAITMAVNKCTFQEKLLISAMIPSLIKIIRSVPKSEAEELLVKLWPPEVDTPRATASTDQTPTDQPKH